MANAGASYEVFQPAVRIERRTPLTFDSGVMPEEFTELLSWDAPERALVRIPGARLMGGTGLVVLPTGQFVGELIGLTPEGRRDGLANELLGRPRRPSKSSRSGSFYAALGLGVINYHHFTHDVVMKLSRVIDLLPADTQLIVPEPLAPFQREALQLVAPEERFVGMSRDEEWRLENLYVVTPIAKSLVDTSEHFERYRTAMFRRIGRPHTAPSRRLFISRRNDNYRRVVNESEVERSLRKYGFEIVFPARLDLASQARLFAEAQVVLGSGSGLSNMVFMQPGSRVVEFYERTLVHTTFWAMAEALSLDYFFFRCDGVAAGEGAPDLQVPIAALEATLDAAVS